MYSHYTNMKHICLLSCIILYLVSCSHEDQDNGPASPPAPTRGELAVPPGFPQPYIPVFNPQTVEGIQLGHMLYYDSILSTNGLRCASCHISSASFSSPVFFPLAGGQISVPPHVNLAWNPDYNWEGSASMLDHVALGDFEPEFFNTNMALLVQKLKQHPEYPELFYKAFGIIDVSKLSYDDLKLKISYALTQYLRTMVSANSRFDKFVNHQINLTNEEFDGFLTYSTERGDCFHCHGTILLTNNTYHNNGLDTLFTGFNRGRYLVTGDLHDMGKFSAPTLRNVELTAPYMHDGRFSTLEEVVEFYNSGVHLNSPNIDPIMTKPAKLTGLNLTEQQKTNLVLFLKALTDTTFINNPSFLDPF